MSQPQLTIQLPGSHGRRLDINFAGVHDLVLVGFRSFNALALSLGYLLQLELHLLAPELRYFHGLRFRREADAACLDLVHPGDDGVLEGLEFPFDINLVNKKNSLLS